MKTLLCSLALLFAAAELASAEQGHPAGGPPGKLTVAVGNTTGSAGGEADVPISITGAASLSALELVVTYDPAILEAKSAERGALLSSNSLVENYNNPSGRLAVTMVSQDGVNGDGPVLVAHFLVKGKAGQKSPLRLENVRAWGGKTRLDFLVSATAGEFTVGSGWPWWWVAIAVAVVLLLLLLMRKATKRGAGPTATAGAPQSRAACLPQMRTTLRAWYGFLFPLRSKADFKLTRIRDREIFRLPPAGRGPHPHPVGLLVDVATSTNLSYPQSPRERLPRVSPERLSPARAKVSFRERLQLGLGDRLVIRLAAARRREKFRMLLATAQDHQPIVIVKIVERTQHGL